MLCLQCCILFFLYNQSGHLQESVEKLNIRNGPSGQLQLRNMLSSFARGSSPYDRIERLKNPAKVPCGNKELHDVMVSLADQFETAYITCMDPELREEPECGMSFLKPYRAVIRRLHKFTRDHDEMFVTVQYGCLDGRSNDPLYGALIKQPPQYSLSNWHGILVEPAFMDKLKLTYGSFAAINGVMLEQMKFAEGAINTPQNIDTEGMCHFYKVVPGGECPLKKEWVSQISGLSENGLRGFFKQNFDQCVQDIRMRCWTPGQLLSEHGFNMIRSTAVSPFNFDKGSLSFGEEKTFYNGDKYCLDKSKLGGFRKIDLLVVDVEGYDGDLVMSTLNELCPELWPAAILYEDKVMRYNSKVKHHDSTVEADNIIEFLESRGYYCMLNGEDVIAMRIGYAVKDLVHATQFRLHKNLTWFHSRRGPIEKIPDTVG